LASTAPKHARPLSPHLGIYKWGPAMTVSILHRITGSGMATVGTVLMIWWLAALASGPAAYASFVGCFTVEGGGLNILGYVLLIGLTLSFFQHLASGVRHFVLDAGAGYELKANRTGAVLTMVFSVAATVALWAYLLVGKN
jgi:succinate dehydrogenase / fumarate reductase, cytochrome b subunit